MVLAPLLAPLRYLLQVAFQVFWRVAWQLMDDFLTVGLQGFLVDGLEDFTLDVVLQLLPRVTPGKETRGEGAAGQFKSGLLVL